MRCEHSALHKLTENINKFHHYSEKIQVYLRKSHKMQHLPLAMQTTPLPYEAIYNYVEKVANRA